MNMHGAFARISKSVGMVAAAGLFAAMAPVQAAPADPAGNGTAPAVSASVEGGSGAPAQARTPTKKYCVVTTITGSRIANKTCKTREQWMKEDGYDPLEDL